jgi:hypothetical protein
MDLNLEPDDGVVGNDGLTDKQRAVLAKRYRETAGNPRLSDAEKEAYKQWKANKHD